MFKHILLPTDGSESSEKVIKSGIKFAQETGAKVTGFFAAPDFPPMLYAEWGAELLAQQDYDEMTKTQTREYLAVIEKEAKAAGVPCECFSISSNSPYTAIIKAAEDKKCDLIFMASHGRKGIAAVLLGSETIRVLTHSKIPVLVYR